MRRATKTAEIASRGESKVGAVSEQKGVLRAVYRLVGRGHNDQDIAKELNITEARVHHCVSLMLRYLNMTDRLDLVRHASAIV
jgi:DNA-binding NarL/FixJ family response regulator